VYYGTAFNMEIQRSGRNSKLKQEEFDRKLRSRAFLSPQPSTLKRLKWNLTPIKAQNISKGSKPPQSPVPPKTTMANSIAVKMESSTKGGRPYEMRRVNGCLKAESFKSNEKSEKSENFHVGTTTPRNSQTAVKFAYVPKNVSTRLFQPVSRNKKRENHVQERKLGHDAHVERRI
jgi:hypothetical protein